MPPAQIPPEITRNWQDTVDLLAEIMQVSSAVIMRAEPPDIKVFVSSSSNADLFEVGSHNTGLYCREVMKTGQPLLVPDARGDERFKSSPDVERGMISYLGLPISWPDGEVFGTICVYDNKRNDYSELYVRLLRRWRDVLQGDLKVLTTLHRQVQDREIKIRRLVEANIIGIFIWDFDGRILEANDAFLSIVGYDREDLVTGRLRWTDLTPPDWRERDAQWVEEHKRTGLREPIEKEYFRKDGSRVPILLGAATFDVNESQGVGFVLDLTERKRTENELRRTKARLEEAQRIAHVGWWERDFTTNQVSLSDEASRIFGVQAVAMPEWHGRWLNVIHPEDRPRTAEAAAAALRGGPRYDVEYRVVRPDGAVRIVHSQGDVTWDESGRPLRQFGVMQDITELRQAEQELRASEARFRTFVDYATDAFMLHAEDGTVIDVNRQACESLGYSRDELIGMSPLDFDPDATAAFLQAIRERLEKGETVTFESRHRRKDGTIFPVEVRVREFREDGLRLIISLTRDITERRRAAEALRDMQVELAHVNRVATMGQLTASIAHEVNQPVAAALTNAQAGLRWLAARPPDLDEVRQAFGRIIECAGRAGEVIGRIRNLIRKAPPRKDQLNINEAILDVVALTRSEALKHGVLLHTQLATGLPCVEGDRVQLQQVILNLVMNAIEAMSGLDEAPRELLINTGTDAAGDVLVSVHDSGTGLEEQSAERLFEPFYTTKPAGIGMGLAICRSIIEAHGGRMWASANEPRGAVFQFTIPTERDEIVQPEHAGPMAVACGGSSGGATRISCR